MMVQGLEARMISSLADGVLTISTSGVGGLLGLDSAHTQIDNKAMVMMAMIARVETWVIRFMSIRK